MTWPLIGLVAIMVTEAGGTMWLPGQAQVVAPGEGRIVDLGVTRMRVLAAGATTGRAFTLAEFAGDEGPWTVPHLHRAIEESFFVLDGGLRDPAIRAAIFARYDSVPVR